MIAESDLQRTMQAAAQLAAELTLLSTALEASRPALPVMDSGTDLSPRELDLMRQRDYWEQRWSLQAKLCEEQQALIKLNREYPRILQGKTNDLAFLVASVPEADGSVGKALQWIEKMKGRRGC